MIADARCDDIQKHGIEKSSNDSRISVNDAPQAERQGGRPNADETQSRNRRLNSAEDNRRGYSIFNKQYVIGIKCENNNNVRSV